MSQQQNILLDWKYEDSKNRSPIWYIIAFSVAVGLVIWGFFTKQYGMSIVIMLISGFFFFLENNSDDEVSVIISDLGIKVQERFYDYSKIELFQLVYQGDQAIFLRLFIKQKGISNVSLRIDNSIANNVRTVLGGYIEEGNKQDISLTEKITNYLKL